MAALAQAGCMACLALGAACAEPAPETAGPQDGAAIAFDIAAREVGAALDEYSRLTGLAVLVDSTAARRGAAALRGRYAAPDALQRLLAGTGLQAYYLNPKSIVVSESLAPRDLPVLAAPAPLALANLPGVAAGASDHQYYLGQVQAALRAALCRSALTRPGGYRLALQLRLNPDGRVARMRLLDSSGDAARDAAIARVLGALDIGAPPPAALPQPLSLLLLPEGPQADADCPALALSGR